MPGKTPPKAQHLAGFRFPLLYQCLDARTTCYSIVSGFSDRSGYEFAKEDHTPGRGRPQGVINRSSTRDS